MKKALVIMMALALLFAMGGMALAKQEPAGAPGNIVASDYDISGKNWLYYEEGKPATSGSYTGSTGFGLSTHPYGTWNSPYTAGVDGYNYNDAQDYVAGGKMVDRDGDGEFTDDGVFTSGPHGGYLTSTHRCRECHAVHRAAGKFKLLRSDTRFEACDWCHGTGAGSGYNIQMDNNDAFTTEYNVGHTMGFGISTGKWKAPDDTYPAFTPNYWQGGFSCFDCHSPHANPARMLGFNNAGRPVGIVAIDGTGNVKGQVYGIVNSGGDDWATALKKDDNPQGTNKPFWKSGSWLLIKNPDREIASTTSTIESGILKLGGKKMSEITFDAKNQPILDAEVSSITINPGQEIPDNIVGGLREFDKNTSYPVNKIAIDWDAPMGNARTLWKHTTAGVTAKFPKSTGEAIGFLGMNVRRSEAIATWINTDTTSDYTFTEKYTTDATNSKGVAFSATAPCNVWSVSDFCTDCHDGNAGKHTVQAPLFSEDRALRGTTTSGSDGNTVNDRAHYDLAYGHDSQPRH
ncbi:MAG: hypothetical protein KGZ93_04660 [Actinobacteria bacterium]|nr:hypothetical protein [Actinomycetota bacterium]